MMHAGWKSIFFAILLVVAGFGCDKKDDKNKGKDGEGSGSSGFTKARVQFVSDTLAAAGLHAESDAKDCGFSLDIYRGEGSCITPLSVTGHAAGVSVSAPSTGDISFEAQSARILGADESTEKEGKIIPGNKFDFADATANMVGDNTLWTMYQYKTKFDYIGTSLTYLMTKFKVKDKFVTMLIPGHDQPFAQSEVVTACVPEEFRSQSRYTEADILTGMTFKRGDYLFCVKDAADAECAAADYKWFDTDTKTLVATRPTNPRKNTYLSDKDKMVCNNEGGERYNFTINGLNVAAKVGDGEGFQLWADFSHGDRSNQWKDAKTPLDQPAAEGTDPEENPQEPYLIYYYKPANGTETSGSNLKVTLNFDATDMIYVDGLRESDHSSSTLEQILEKTYTKQDWVFQKKADGGVVGHGVEQYWSMSVKPTIEITGGTSAPDPL